MKENAMRAWIVGSGRLPFIAALAAAGLLLLPSCGGDSAKPATPSPGGSAPATPGSGRAFPAEQPAGQPAAGALTQKVKVKSGAETTAFSIKPKEDGAKVVDGSENELFRLKMDGDKIKVKDPADKALGYVGPNEAGKIKIKDASKEKVLFTVQRQEDGDFKVEDRGGALLYRVKKRDYGFEIEDAADKSLYKVKVKDGKTSLRDSSDTTVLYTNEPASAAGFAAFGLDKMDRGLQAGLFLRMTLAGY